MKNLNLAQTLQLLGNVGVIVGIFLLVYELNQNRAMMAAQMRTSIAQATVMVVDNQSRDARLAEIMLKANGGEPLTSVEQEQFRLAWWAFVRLWENSHYQYRNGLFDDEEFFAVRTSWLRALTAEPVREFWCTNQHEFSPEFATDMNNLMEKKC